MKIFYFIIILILLNNCSFDNKTGIWKNEKNISLKNDNQFKDFIKISDIEQVFDETIYLDNNISFNKVTPIDNFEWKDIFYSKNNNLSNFIYKDTNEIKFKSKKISRSNIRDNLLVENENIITSDLDGNLIIYSIITNSNFKFNFYKKKYKKIKKKLNIIVEDKKIFVSDNLGYLYAYDYFNKKVLWAKKYDIPFRSNIKIFENKIITSNQDNNLIFFDKFKGNIIKVIPTEENNIKNKFVNNLSVGKNSLFFLNSFGSLYSIDNNNMEVIWFINLSQTLGSDPSNLFFGSEIINKDNKIIVSSNQNTYVIDSNNGSILTKKNFSSNLKPIIYSDYIFFVTQNDYLICMDFQGKILYSHNINQLIANFLNSKKKQAEFKSFYILNDKIFIFLENSFFLKFSISGDLTSIEKLPLKLNTSPIIIDKSLLYIDKKNRIVMVN